MRAEGGASDGAVNSKAHVGEQTVAVRAQENVFGLQVSVQNAAAVHVFDSENQLGDDEASHILAETPAG
jgi:hypothetical protein